MLLSFFETKKRKHIKKKKDNSQNHWQFMKQL